MSKFMGWFGFRKPNCQQYDVQRELQYWKDNLGKFSPPDESKRFVLIKEPPKTVLYFDTYNDAIAEGYKRFRTQPFLVQSIDDSPIQVARCSHPEECPQLPE